MLRCGSVNWKNSTKADKIFCFDSADKSLPIHNISWAISDKSDQQKAGRRRRGRGLQEIQEKGLKLVLNVQRMNLHVLNMLPGL